MIIGSLFLCLSTTIVDVLLNSCACALISGVDNRILQLSGKMKGMAGFQRSHVVYFPYQPRIIKTLDYLVCVFPIIPAAFSCLMCYIGLYAWRLYIPPKD